MIHYELSVRGLWYDVYEAMAVPSPKKLTQILTDNGSWTLYKKTNATTQISQILTNQRWGKRREGETEDVMRRKTARGEYLSEKHSCSLSVCVYFLKMLLVVIFQYQILLAWEILWALQQTAGVLSSLVTERERGPQRHTGLLSGHTGVI